MSALEEIQIRVTEGTREELIVQLRESLDSMEPIDDLNSLQIFCHTKYETDLCLHLHWAKPLSVQGSTLALQILSGIQELGSVKHTVWTTKEVR